MTNDETLRFLSLWMARSVDPDAAAATMKYARMANRAHPAVVAHLWNLFRRVVDSQADSFLKWDCEARTLYAYNGRWFERTDGLPFLREVVRRALEAMGVHVVYQLAAPEKIADACLSAICVNERYYWEPDRRYICFTNGVFDIRTGKLSDFSPACPTEIVLDFEYRAHVDFPLWDVKIGGEGDREQAIIPGRGFLSAFQQWCGALLAKRDELKFEYICYLYGSGANGKSVAASAIAGVFGEEYYTTFTPKQLFRDSSSGFNLSAVRGKILNLCDDLSNQDFSGGEFKRFASGEKFNTRAPYGRKHIWVTPPLFLCCTNTFPDTADDSWGHHRRQLVIQTTYKQWGAGERDPLLSAKFRETKARQRIFNWIYEGYRELMRNGGDIALSEEVVRANQMRMNDSSPLRRWAFERNYVAAVPTGKSDPRWKPLEKFYKDYAKYAGLAPKTKGGDRRRIAALFRSAGAVSEVRREGTHFCIGIRGVDTDADGKYIGKPVPDSHVLMRERDKSESEYDTSYKINRKTKSDET